MRAGDGSLVARVRIKARTVSVRPPPPHTLAGHVADQQHHVGIVDHEHIAEVAAHKLGLGGRLGDHTEVEAVDRSPVADVRKTKPPADRVHLAISKLKETIWLLPRQDG
jgi:hypothetical protein